MNGKSDDPKAGTKIVSERQLCLAAKAALRKADRFWRLAQKASSESYKEHRAKQAMDASDLAADKTRQANELRAIALRLRGEAD